MLTTTAGITSTVSNEKRLSRSRTSSLTHASSDFTKEAKEKATKKKRKVVKSVENQQHPIPVESLDASSFSAQLLLSDTEYQRLKELEEIITKNSKCGHFYPLCKLNV